MPDLTLHGNGEECPACALQREALDADHSLMVRPTIPCQLCGSVGRVARTPEAIAREAVAEARRSYWPQQEAREAAHNAKGAGDHPAPRRKRGAAVKPRTSGSGVEPGL